MTPVSDFGIAYEDGKYAFERHRYDKLEDAIAYAKKRGY